MPIRWLFSLALVGAFAAMPVRAGDDPAVAHVALFLEAFGHQSGLPQGDDATAIRPHLSAALNAAIDAARAEQARHIAKHPDEKPPWIEGPLFNSSGHEPYTAHAIVPPEGGCGGDRCTLRIDFSDTSVTPAVAWHDDYELVREDGQWRLDDVRFRAGFAYGNHGSLRANLAATDRGD